MTLGFAPNANFTMATANPFTSLLDVKKVHGPLGCTAAMCKDAWAMATEGAAAVCEQLAASCTFDATANVLSCPATGGGGSGGAMPGTGGAGGAGSTGTGGATTTGGKTGGTAGGSSSGCGCVFAPYDHDMRAPAVIGVFFALTLFRRHRGRRASSACAPERARRSGAALMTILLVAAVGVTTSGCSSGAAANTVDAEVFNNCEDRGEEFFAGISKTSGDGAITMAIVSAEPAPPANTDKNSWTVTLTDASGMLVTGATLVAAPFMIDHGHGAPNVFASEATAGSYDLAPIYLKMTGLWQVTLKATPAGGTENRVMFPFCIPPK
jgi:hypothetical protein